MPDTKPTDAKPKESPDDKGKSLEQSKQVDVERNKRLNDTKGDPREHDQS